MIASRLVLLCVLLATACTDRPEAPGSGGSDAIQQLVDRLSADASAEWNSGMYPNLGLEASATVEEVLDRLFQMVSFNDGQVTEFSVTELRGVVIGAQPPERYNAATVDTNLGTKIVLFRWQRQDWWTRAYDVALSD